VCVCLCVSVFLIQNVFSVQVAALNATSFIHATVSLFVRLHRAGMGSRALKGS
jgi:hypothetical protein